MLVYQLGFPYLVDETGFYWPFSPWRSKYYPKYMKSISPEGEGGHNLGECLVRVLCVHLFGYHFTQPAIAEEGSMFYNINKDITLLLDEGESFANADLDGMVVFPFKNFYNGIIILLLQNNMRIFYQ